jgi:hypothetical protein
MGSKKANYIEQYLDKIVIGAAALLAVIIVFMFVVQQPKVDDQTPGDIESSISRNTEQLKQRLNDEPNSKMQYASKQKDFLALMGDSIDGDVNDNINFPLPGQKQGAMQEQYTYNAPKIGAIGKASLAVVKMAAFVPTEELSTTVTYDSAGKKIEDLDLVTVESSIDVKALYSKFRDSFAAKSFPAEKKKEQYAKPVFAKVQLQRKTQQSDGNWSQWTDIPQTKVCYLKKNLELPKEPSDYAIEMAMVQFAKSEFRNEILQPAVYCNAIPTDPWISPSFYNQRKIKLDKFEEENRKAEAEAKKSQKLQDRTNTPSRETHTAAPSRMEGPGMGMGMPGMGGGGGAGGGRQRETASRNTRRETATRQPTTSRRTTTERTVRPERETTTTTTAQNVLDLTEETSFKEISLTNDTNFDELDKLVFWAHDDTTKPGEKYEYRIRIGVFNPMAGKDAFAEGEKEYSKEVVFWSDYAEVNEVTDIPQRLYFFPTTCREVDKGGTSDKIVEVMVARYMLGNWVSKKYSNVKCGEQIGKADEQPDTKLVNAGLSSDPIDFSTGATMVDARKVASAGKVGEYYELLYTYDGNNIEKTPVKDKNWSPKVLQVYKEISSAIEKDPVVLLSWDQAATESARRTAPTNQGFDNDTRRGTPGMEGPGMMPMMPGGPGMP